MPPFGKDVGPNVRPMANRVSSHTNTHGLKRSRSQNMEFILSALTRRPISYKVIIEYHEDFLEYDNETTQ